MDVVHTKDLIVRKVGEGAIILCYCTECKGIRPVIITHGDWLAEKKRMCKNTVHRIIEYLK